MGSVFDCVSKIQTGREAWRLKVRIVRLWSVPSFINPDTVNSLEMVLVDEYGGRIQASVKRSLLYIFEPKLTEGFVYKMCFFSVVSNTGYYKSTTHEYKLLFQPKTKITQSESSVIPMYGLSLVNTDYVHKHTAESHHLVDIIGLLTAASEEREYIKDGKITKMLVIELTDHRGRVECALFGDYSDEFNTFKRNGPGETPVIIIQFAKIKIFKGNPVVQNVMKTTRLLLNLPIPEVIEFRNSLALHGIEADQPIGVLGAGSNVTKEHEFLRMHPKKTLSELHQCDDDGVYVVRAKVVRLVESAGWWYPGCKCHRAVTPDAGLYYCGGCYRHVIQITPRFKLRVDVSDGVDTAVFIMFDSDVQWLTKKSCVELVTSAELGPLAACPEELGAIVGKDMLFKVEKKMDMGSFFDESYCVKKICDDDAVITLFESSGQQFTPEKSTFQPSFPPVVNLDDDEDTDLSGQTEKFVSRVILSPCSLEEGSCSQAFDIGPAKRKLVDMFDEEVDLDADLPLKEVKIEKV